MNLFNFLPIHETVDHVQGCYYWLKSKNRILDITLSKVEHVSVVVKHTAEQIVINKCNLLF